MRIGDFLNVSSDELELWFSWSVVMSHEHPPIPRKYGLEIRSEVVSVFGNTLFDLYEREDHSLLLLEYDTGFTCIGLRSISQNLSKDIFASGLVFGSHYCTHQTHLKGMIARHESFKKWYREYDTDEENDWYNDSDSESSDENDWMADY